MTFSNRFLLCLTALADLHGVALCQTPNGVTTAAGGSIPVTFKLDKAGYVTLVVEDAQGHRVANLLSETYLPAGEHRVVWDGYDTGTEKNKTVWERHRVTPGNYHLRGITHGGVHMIYEMSVYSHGTPPWFTADGSGTWMADHSPPSSALFLPAGSPYGDGKPQMLLGANVGESGHALVWTDLTGRKFNGAKINGWMGGKALASDAGPERDSRFYAYTLFITNPSGGVTGNAGVNGAFNIYGLSASKDNPFISLFKYEPSKPVPYDGYRCPVSFAVRNNIAVMSNPLDNELLFIDLNTGQLLGKTILPTLRGVCFDANGSLYVVTDHQIKRFDAANLSTATLGEAKTVVATGLEDPRQLIVDAGGQLYVSDWGKSHQIKLFSTLGNLVRTIGRAGSPQVGAYDQQRMHNPNGMALDGNGNLWVAKDDFLPKRVSVWNLSDGHLVRAIYGGPQYGGGGTLDAFDKTLFFYASSFNFGSLGGMEWKLDWKTGSSRLVNIYMRNPEPTGESATPGNAVPPTFQEFTPADDLPETAVPERRVVIGKNEYMIGTYNSVARGNQNAGIWKLDKQGVAWPVAFVGGGTSWFQDFFDGNRTKNPRVKPEVTQAVLAAAKAQGGDWGDVFASWSDLNGNHRLDANEWKVRVFPRSETNYASEDGRGDHANFFSHNSLSATDLSFTGGWTVQVPAPSINAQGIPIYDLKAAHLAIPPQTTFRDRIDGDVARPWLAGEAGWLVQPPTRGYKNGALQWTYPDQDARFAPQRPGEITTISRVIGPLFKPIQGQAGQMFAENDDKGAVYLMTIDGLYVQTLGGDMRQKALWRMPQAKRGMEIKDVSFEDELFHPSLTQTADGKIYLVVGKEHISILRLDGLETVQRRDFGTLLVSPESLQGLPQRLVRGSETSARKTLSVPLSATPPTVDGNLQDWNATEASWAPLDTRASASFKIADGKLYAAYKTGDANLLQNNGTQSAFLFKSGGALDLMLSTHPGENHPNAPVKGDLRLLVTQVDGKTRATLYRAISPTAPATAKVEFTSPVSRVDFDEVRDVSADVQLAAANGNFEFSIPLAVLDFSPRAGAVYRGDVGVLRGAIGQTIQRLYWNNIDTAIVSDVPSEARLQPNNWGNFSFALEAAH